MKHLTGGDRITARFLFREHFEFTPAFTLWLVANHAPQVRHEDDAVWRRILRVPFSITVPKERRDPSLKATLKDTADLGAGDPGLGGARLSRVAAAGPRRSPAGRGGHCRVPRLSQDPLASFLEDRCIARRRTRTVRARRCGVPTSRGARCERRGADLDPVPSVTSSAATVASRGTLAHGRGWRASAWSVNREVTG